MLISKGANALMKILHMADVHLDSRLTRYLDEKRARERRNEILLTFKAAINLAAENEVDAVIIAGDLFDVRRISATARDAVRDAIQQNPQITFFYLRGNHDADGFVEALVQKNGVLPENLKMFSDEWTSYEFTSKDGVSVIITGAEMTAQNNSRLVSSLTLDHSRFNIVVLHGQEIETAAKKDAEVIPLREYRNRGIDYMALGHIHEPKIERLDIRGIYSYSGCLEGRGYDECGPRGFNLLQVTHEADGKPGMKVKFVPFARRTIYRIGINSANDSSSIIREVKRQAEDLEITSDDMLRVEITGRIRPDADIDISFIEKALEEYFFHIKVVDKTRPFIDYDSFMLDMSLRGEFVRLIDSKQKQGLLDEESAALITRTGIELLAGEEGAL